jgi:hypothetical protein
MAPKSPETSVVGGIKKKKWNREGAKTPSAPSLSPKFEVSWLF